MSLGLCCQWLENTPKGFKNILVSKTLQLGRLQRGEYSKDRIAATYLTNVQCLAEVFPRIVQSGIRSFRVSSSLFPLWDLVDRALWDNKIIKDQLNSIGQSALKAGVRITMHPGQFCVLSSDSEKVQLNSLAEIGMHAWVMDQMSLPENSYYSINIHGGKSGAAKKLVDGINKLVPSAKARLTLENCEFAYSISQLLDVSRETGTPLVFDSHHHAFNTGGLSGPEAMEAAISTWPAQIKPLTHLSNSKPIYVNKNVSVTKLREHSDSLHSFPDYQLLANNKGAIDIDIEAKNKNHAIFDAVAKFRVEL